MTECDLCNAINDPSLVLFSDENVAAVVAKTPAAPGHVWIAPRKHHPILEMVPDPILRRMTAVANKVSMAVFEAVGCQGTNLLIQNGLPAGQSLPHFAMSIIPRRENDGLRLEWKGGEVPQEESEKAEVFIKEASQSIGIFDKEPPAPLEEKKSKPQEFKESDMRMKQLRRIP